MQCALSPYKQENTRMRTREGPRVGKRDKPRESVTGSNSIAYGQLGSDWVTTGGESKDEGHGKRCHGRRQLVGGRDLRNKRRNETHQVPNRGP